MLSGGEKSKLKKLVVAINQKYPTILDILETNNLKKNHLQLLELSKIVSLIFRWTSNLSYMTIRSNPILEKGFDSLQNANRKAQLNTRNMREVDLLLDAVDAIYDMQKEYIKIVDEDSNLNKSVLKEIMEELGIKDNSASKVSSTGGNRRYQSIDDLFADLED